MNSKLPKGRGKRKPITSLEGDKNSIQIKKSIVTIDNDDQLCMARAIGVGWAKLNRCTKEEWDDLTRYQKSKSQLELVLEHRKAPESYYKHLINKTRKEQKNLAVALSRLAGVPLDRPREFERRRGVRESPGHSSDGGERSTG